jgi:hypothetical protein
MAMLKPRGYLLGVHPSTPNEACIEEFFERTGMVRQPSCEELVLHVVVILARPALASHHCLFDHYMAYPLVI